MSSKNPNGIFWRTYINMNKQKQKIIRGGAFLYLSESKK
jgi:hypothetical protein